MNKEVDLHVQISHMKFEPTIKLSFKTRCNITTDSPESL